MTNTKKGITLVELICTLAITGFLFTILGSTISAIGAQYTRVMDVTRAKASATLMLQTLETKPRLGYEAMLCNEELTGYNNVWYQDAADKRFKQKIGGTVKELFDLSFYCNKFKYKIEYYIMNEHSVKIVIYVRNSQDEMLYNGETVTSLLNVSPKDHKKVLSAAGESGTAIFMFNQ